MITTGLIKYIVAIVGNMVKGIINDHEVKVEVFVEVYFKIITRKSVMFVRS